MTAPSTSTSPDRLDQSDIFVADAPGTPSPLQKGSYRARLYRVWVENYSYVSNVARVIGLVATVKASVFLNFIYRALATTSLTWNQHVWIVKVVKNIKLLSVISLPFALYSVLSSGWKVISSKEKIDSALNAIEGLSWLGDSASTFIAGLDVVGLLERTAKLTSALSLLSVVLASATIFINIRRIRQGQEAIQEMNAAVGDGESNVAAVVKMMSEKDKYYLEKVFGVNSSRLQRTLLTINQNAKNADGHVGEQALVNTVDSLKKRIISKKLSHQLTIVSTAIALIGMSILLLNPLLAVAAYYILTASGAVAALNFFYERRSTKLFQSLLQQIQNG
jgi:hypothetical protein